MPSTSKKQHNFMEAIAHGMKPRKGGPSKAVAQDFAAADKGRKFGSGGRVRKKFKHHAKLRPPPMAPMAPPDMGSPPGGPPMGGPPMGGPPPGMGMKKGGSVKGRHVTRVPKTENAGGEGKIGGSIEQKGRTKTRIVKMAGGGSVRGDGCASKGHTKGRMV